MLIQTVEIGEFAKGVADLLEEEHAMVRISSEQYEPGKFCLSEDTDVCVLLSEHLCVDLAKSLDLEAHRLGKIFIPVIIDAPYLTIGPFVKTGFEGCFHCYYYRYMQHNPMPEVTNELNRYYSTRLGQGPKGYHPADVVITANRLLQLLRGKAEEHAGKLVRLNMATRESIASAISGVHGCERCGLKQDEKQRSYANLAQYFGISMT